MPSALLPSVYMAVLLLVAPFIASSNSSLELFSSHSRSSTSMVIRGHMPPHDGSPSPLPIAFFMISSSKLPGYWLFVSSARGSPMRDGSAILLPANLTCKASKCISTGSTPAILSTIVILEPRTAPVAFLSEAYYSLAISFFHAIWPLHPISAPHVAIVLIIPI